MTELESALRRLIEIKMVEDIPWSAKGQWVALVLGATFIDAKGDLPADEGMKKVDELTKYAAQLAAAHEALKDQLKSTSTTKAKIKDMFNLDDSNKK